LITQLIELTYCKSSFALSWWKFLYLIGFTSNIIVGLMYVICSWGELESWWIGARVVGDIWCSCSEGPCAKVGKQSWQQSGCLSHWQGPSKHTHTEPFYGSLYFIRDNPGEPVPEETLPLTSIVVINHPLSASSIYFNPWHPPCSIYVPD